MNFQFNSNPSSSQTLIIPLCKGDELEKHLTDIAFEHQLFAEQLQKDFKGEKGEVLHLYASSSSLTNIFLLGLGKNTDFGHVLKTFRSFGYQQKKRLNQQSAIQFSHLFMKLDHPTQLSVIEAAINGLLLSTYKIGLYKKEDTNEIPFHNEETVVEIISPLGADLQVKKAVQDGEAVAKTQLRILDLVNAPGNKVRPSELAAWAKKSGQHYGYEVEVMNKEQIIATGLEALLAVNRGSEWPPAFIIMKYSPKESKENIPTIGLVGKGVTFDTGGLSIKGSNRMHYMKSDMGGAAAVLGAIELTARLQLPVHLIAIVPTTDNCVDATSVKPGDVIGSYSGKTIEVIDTDAEGRLILADGLAYMRKHFNPEVMIDLATLTGSCVRTLGYQAGGLFSNNDQLASQLTATGEQFGERLWRLPLWEAYQKDIESDVADVRNFSSRPVAGAISAAKFLEAFTDDHPAWAHLDIAGVAFGDSEFTTDKSATAYGVRLLCEFFKNYSASS